jgi:outer membrane protein OmpA-like peptidoglycan-associated protein
MKRTRRPRWIEWTALAVVACLAAACASVGGPYTTDRDKTKKGAGIGAVAGAVAAILNGKDEADEILAGAAIGAAVGAGVGAYMDAQEEKIARIPGTVVERVDPATLLVHFDSDILFAIDSARLEGGARAALDDMAGVINEFRKTAVIVQGHTDATGSESHNQDLSERRAKAVKNHLIGRGVAPNRLTAIGYGETAPRASNATESGRRANRRVDLMLRARAR